MTTVTVEAIPALLRVADVCRHLKLSRTQFYEQRARLQAMGVLVEQQPALTARPRYLGAPIATFLSAERQAHELRKTLRQVASR